MFFWLLLLVTFNSNITDFSGCLRKAASTPSKSTDNKLPPHEDFYVKACVKIFELATSNIRESRAPSIRKKNIMSCGMTSYKPTAFLAGSAVMRSPVWHR